MIVRSLEAHGVDVVFGIPGEHNIEIYRALGDSRIRHVTPRHEQGAGFMADAYARTTGKVGVAIVVTGPGLTNVATPLAQAYTDSVPLLVISGQVRSTTIGMGGQFHELKDQTGFSGSLVSWSASVGSVTDIPAVMARALTALQTGQARGVHLEFPQDVLSARASISIPEPVHSQPVAPSPVSVARAAAVLSAARMPGIIIGGGGREAGQALARIAEQIGAPMITTWRGSGAVPAHHPLSAGGGTEYPAATAFIQACDALLIVGSELAQVDFFPSFPTTSACIVRIDRDPGRIARGCQAEVELIGDAVLAANELVRVLDQTPERMDQGFLRTQALRDAIDHDAAAHAAPYRRTVETLRATLPGEAILACDLTGPVYWAVTRHFPVDEPNRILMSGIGTLGYSVPAAIGAKVADARRPAVALVGDGGFLFTAPELMTAAELGLNPIVVVWNNHGFGDIRRQLIESGAQPIGVNLESPDFVALARGLRCEGVSLDGASDLRLELERALARTCPTVIEIRADR